MEREQGLDLIPVAHSRALRLEEAGAPPSVIAEALGIDPEAVGPLLEIAERKLHDILYPADKGASGSLV